MAVLNLAFLLVIAEPSGKRADSAFALPQNDDRRLLESTGESSLPNARSLKSGSIPLYLDQPPKDITKGYVFGSEQSTCDVLLANNKETGISANHFSINVDWVSRDPTITCLSGNNLRHKLTSARKNTILPKNMWQRLEPGSTVDIIVARDLGVSLSVPTRGDLQAAYNLILQDYFTVFKNAVPELANISLRDTEVTPLILHRCPGLDGREYYTTGKLETGDHDYDTKVFLYRANCKATQDTRSVPQGGGRDQDVADWLLNDSKGSRPSELCVVKHFQRKGKMIGLPSRYRELCHLSHLNLEDLVDLIIEPPVLMVVTATFFNTTLHALHQEEPLSTDEAGFVLGQTFAALEYLHDRRWVHGNLDPRSIHVQSRKHLWIKLTDTGLSGYFDLGKPDGYHSMYASQHIAQTDQSPADIWSAGVVALELLLPNGLPHCNSHSSALHTNWLMTLERLAAKVNRKSRNEETALVNSVLKWKIDKRPTAAEILKYPWIVKTKGDPIINNPFVDNPNDNVPTPKGPRPTGSAPSPFSSRHSSKFSSRQGSAPPLEVSRQSSVVPTEIFPHQALDAMDKEYKLSSDYIDVDGIDWNVLNSPNGVLTPNQLSRESPAPPEFDSDGNPIKHRSARPPSPNYRGKSPAVHSEYGSIASGRNRRAPQLSDFNDKTLDAKGGPSSLGSRYSGGQGQTSLSDWATGTFRPVEEQEKVKVEEDSGEETETGGRPGPVTKKPRKGKDIPPPKWDLRSRGKGRA